MGKLSELMTLYGSDKAPEWHNYTPIYEKWLATIEVDSLLEIGFGAGSSIRSWMDYFPNSNIYCMEFASSEYENQWKKPDLNLPRMNLVLGDSTKKETWDRVPYNLSVVVDDGSHIHQHQIDTFLNGFKHIRSKGLYFLEDTHMGMETRYGSSVLIYQWLYERMIYQQCPQVETGGDFYKAINYMDELTRTIYSIHSYKSMVIFEKA